MHRPHRLAIIGVGTTGFSSAAEESPRSLVSRAIVAALDDAGVNRASVDGVCGTGPDVRDVVAAIGIPQVRWFSTNPPPIGFAFISAAMAVASGLCEMVVVYNSAYRSPWVSRAAAKDPFRREIGRASSRFDPETVKGGEGYAAWASRYLHDYGGTKEDFGLVAINSRSHAVTNPLAIAREHLDMSTYVSSRMIRSPLNLFDMDRPVDGADAFVLTSAERGRDLHSTPVLLHAAACGMLDKNDEAQTPGLRRHAQHVVADALRENSEFTPRDADVLLLYDGFTLLTLTWLESLGLCGPGEAGSLLREGWDPTTATAKIDRRIPLNTHGGSLSEGATQGSGQIREAVHRLRASSGSRRVAFVAMGGLFYNAQALVLTTT